MPPKIKVIYIYLNKINICCYRIGDHKISIKISIKTFSPPIFCIFIFLSVCYPCVYFSMTRLYETLFHIEEQQTADNDIKLEKLIKYMDTLI